MYLQALATSITPNTHNTPKTGSKNNDVLFALPTRPDNTTTAIAMNLTHRRAIYTSENKIRKTIHNVEGFTIVKDSTLSRPCVPYIFSKDHVLPFGKTRLIRIKPRDLLHLDV